MANVVKVWRDPLIGDQYDLTLDTDQYTLNQQLTDSYKVLFDDASATPPEAAIASDGTTRIPSIGTPYGSMICQRIQPRRATNDPRLWSVQVEYRNIPPKKGDKWNVNVKVRSVSFEQDGWQDVDKKDVVNSAKQSFNPTLKRVFYDEELTVSFETQKMSECITAIDECRGKYCDASVTMSINGVSLTFAKGEMLFVSPDYETIYVGEPPYDWKVAYIFRIRKTPPAAPNGVKGPPMAWKDYVVDRGYYTLNADKKVIAGDKYGQHHGEPILLDGQGKELPAGGQPFYLDFDMFGPASFGNLLSGIS